MGFENQGNGKSKFGISYYAIGSGITIQDLQCKLMELCPLDTKTEICGKSRFRRHQMPLGEA